MPTGSGGDWVASVGTTLHDLPWARVGAPFRRVAAWIMALPFWVVFGVVLLAQWAVVGVVASITPHNGWSFYSGGDDSWYYTSAWLLAHGHVPHASVGYGYPILIAPLARIAGPNLLAGLPLVVVFDMLVLWPVALLCVYGIAKRIAGRGYAYVVSLGWTLLPLISIPYFYGRFHDRLVDQSLPSTVGLVATADFTSMVSVMVAAYFGLRALERRGLEAGLAAGLATGFAIVVKPSNLIFLPAPVLALAVARRPRALGGLALGLVPALVGLALWKYRGLGYLPAFQSAPSALAAGAADALPVASIDWHRYVRVDWAQIRRNYFGLREYTWSVRMITWIVVAGVIALARLSPAFAVLIGGWLASFILVKGSSADVSVLDGSFFRFMMPAFPAFFFALAAIPLLVPVLGRYLAARGRAAAVPPEGRRRHVAAYSAAAALTVVPIALFPLIHPLAAPSAVGVPTVNEYVPANTFALTATVKRGGAVVLRWPSQDARGAHTDYAIFRETWEELNCTPGRHGTASCKFFSDPRQSMQLLLPVAWSSSTSYRDRPGKGHWIYRVAATVALGGPPESGNYIAISRRADADVGR